MGTDVQGDFWEIWRCAGAGHLERPVHASLHLVYLGDLKLFRSFQDADEA